MNTVRGILFFLLGVLSSPISLAFILYGLGRAMAEEFYEWLAQDETGPYDN